MIVNSALDKILWKAQKTTIYWKTKDDYNRNISWGPIFTFDFPRMPPCPVSYATGSNAGTAVVMGEIKELRPMETFKSKKNYQSYACFCSAAIMLTSKIITEIVENHSEFSVWTNSCNTLFMSILINCKITCDTVMKRHSTPVAPLLKCRGAMPASYLRSPASLEFTVWHFATKCAAVNL